MAAPSVKYVALLVITLQTTALVLTMRYSRAVAAGPAYLASTAVLLTESCKLCCVLATLWLEHGRSVRRSVATLRYDVFGQPRDTLQLSVPALLYTLQNNLVFTALSHLDAPTFQVSYQLKILVTALMSVMVLEKRVRPMQWVSLVILVLGVCLVQLDRTSAVAPQSAEQSADGARRGSYTIGLLAVLILCMSSGYAGVHFERVLKLGTPKPLSVRNTQLALFAVPFSAAAVVLNDRATIAEVGFFHGYTRYTWIVILLQALGGLAVSATVKYADNILKGFATSLSIILSSLVSSSLLGEAPLSGTFIAGAALVLAATLLYGSSPAQKTKLRSKVD